MQNWAAVGRAKEELRTPALLLDIDAVDRNIAKMAEFSRPLKCSLRPHVKTHKSPFIAHRQIRAGAIGITCAKLEDAKGFINAGIDNVLIANEIPEDKMPDLIGLAQVAHVITCVDSVENATALSKLALKAKMRMDVLVEVDAGLGRCGVAPGEATLEFVRRLAPLRGLSFRGINGYEGGVFLPDDAEKMRVCQHRNQLLVDTRALLEKNGFAVEIVSAGGSNTHTITGLRKEITEIQPGSYVTMDAWNLKFGQPFELAITVLSTVISRPRPDLAVIDAGLKAISTDYGLPTVRNLEGAEIKALTDEEHGRLVLSGAATALPSGTRVELVPTHGCTTIPLHAEYVVMKDGVAVDVIPVMSRGATY